MWIIHVWVIISFIRPNSSHECSFTLTQLNLAVFSVQWIRLGLGLGWCCDLGCLCLYWTVGKLDKRKVQKCFYRGVFNFGVVRHIAPEIWLRILGLTVYLSHEIVSQRQCSGLGWLHDVPHLSVLLDCVSLCLRSFVFVVYRYCICLAYLILFVFLLGQYLVLYSALLSCLDYCLYSLIFTRATLC